MAAQGPKLSLVIPMYNEEANAERVAGELQAELEREKIRHELVLVDNGSSDNTGFILAQLAQESPFIKVVRVPQNQGYGWGIINGLRWASGDYLGFMGGDGQIDPRDVTRVFREILTGEYQLGKVNRCQRQDGLTRKLVSHIFNKLFVYTFKVNVGDINGSPKIMSRRCYEELNLSSKDWFLDAEVMLKANYLKVTVAEVPVVFRRREAGNSSVRVGTVWEFLRNMAAYRKRGVFDEGRDIMWREGDPA
ncbi:MAG: glycosyltransferase family 2 protein [Bacillota bacterium]